MPIDSKQMIASMQQWRQEITEETGTDPLMIKDPETPFERSMRAFDEYEFEVMLARRKLSDKLKT